jgi:hypothetical protein
VTKGRLQFRLLLVVLLGVVTSALALSPTFESSARATGRIPALRVSPGALLTDTSLGPDTQIVYVDMLSASLGYAVAGTIPEGAAPTHPFYLVRTTNLGRSWTIRGHLPISGYWGQDLGTQSVVQFVSSEVGYLWSQDGPLYVTTDAGLTWSKVSTPGIWPTFAIHSSTVSVASEICAKPPPTFGPLKCPSELTQYEVGATKPLRSHLIPARGPAGEWRAARVLSSVSRSTVLVVEGGSEGLQSSLLATTDSGAHWRLVTDPCESLIVAQQFSALADQQFLYCFMGGGMSQGTSELWTSNNSMSSWSLVAKSNEMGSVKGNIGDVSNILYLTNDNSTLLGALGGAAGGLEYSTDLGAHWTFSGINSNRYGGAPEYVSVFGTSGAIFGVQGGAQWVTSNGRRWIQLPQLPAGPYKGLSICTPGRGTSVRLNPTLTGTSPGSRDYPVVFENNGDNTCYLNGYPGVQPDSGPSNTVIGQPAFTAGNGNRGGYVILKAHGGTASVVLESDLASYYSRNYCQPVRMTGIIVTFAPPSRFIVRTPNRAVCRAFPSVQVSGVVSGVVTWL